MNNKICDILWQWIMGPKLENSKESTFRMFLKSQKKRVLNNLWSLELISVYWEDSLDMRDY